MPFYNHLKYKIQKADHSARTRAIRNLQRLRVQLDSSIPAKDSEDTLLLATWNIRDFGKPIKHRRGWGPRLPETWFYIAEVLSRFDFVAVQEVNEVEELEHVMDILGPNWAYIATDATDRAMGGNGERMAFIYDRRKVSFQSIAGELVLPEELLISAAELATDAQGKVVAGKQFVRTPFLASFQSGWLKFDVCTVHLYYGAASGKKLQQRVQEIATVAKFLSDRADRALGRDRALFVLGDFNIVSPTHKTMKALTDNGFVVPKAFQNTATTGTNKYYDQIGFKTKPELLEFVERKSSNPLQRNAGVFGLFDEIFTMKQFPEYEDAVAKHCSPGRKASSSAEREKVYKDWRTYQLSDHYPMWVRLRTDDSDAYLERMLASLG